MQIEITLGNHVLENFFDEFTSKRLTEDDKIAIMEQEIQELVNKFFEEDSNG